MRPVSVTGRAAGFTLIEAAVVVGIVGITAALGMPGMSKWLQGRRAQAAAGYYMDGFQMARNMAIENNAASRLVLSDNAVSGQKQWRVDLCFPTSAAACDAAGAWSTLTTAVTDVYGRSVKSVTRNADGLPPLSMMATSYGAAGATEAYFTPVGWLNAAVSPQLNLITLGPSVSNKKMFSKMAVAVTLAGVASRCDPALAQPAAKACP